MTITIHINRWTVLAVFALIAAAAGLFIPMRASATAPTATPVPSVVPTVNAAVNTSSASGSCETRISTAAVQRMEGGYLIWVGDRRTVYVMYYDAGSTINGTWETFPETWEQGMPETDANFKSTSGLPQPTRGLGLVWRSNPRVKDRVGYGLSDATGYMTVISTQGDKMWFNGRDDAFRFEGNRWWEEYAWRR